MFKLMAVFYDLYLISFPIDFSFSHSRGSVLRERVGCRPVLRICGKFREPFTEAGRPAGSRRGPCEPGLCATNRETLPGGPPCYLSPLFPGELDVRDDGPAQPPEPLLPLPPSSVPSGHVFLVLRWPGMSSLTLCSQTQVCCGQAVS